MLAIAEERCAVEIHMVFILGEVNFMESSIPVYLKMTRVRSVSPIGNAQVIAFVTLLICNLCGCDGFSGPGTDRELEVIFKGRCAEYLTGRVNPHVDPAELGSKNCTLLWELFYNAFVYREPCDVTMDRYTELVQEAASSVPANRAVYWDGFDVYSVVRSYANEANRATTLEFMLIGYIMNGLVFCGQKEDPGIKYDSCPGGMAECGFANGSMDGFWGAASKYFGTHGKGNVKFIVNSNRPGGAFHVENSYFTEFELANMDPSDVTRVDIYIVTFVGEQTSETCTSQSIQTLMSLLTDKGIKYQCMDQPEVLLHVICADNPEAEECTFAESSSGGTGSQQFSFSVTLVSVFLQIILHIKAGWDL